MVTLIKLLVIMIISFTVYSMDACEKGKNIKHTASEYQELLTWIPSNKTSTHGI